jgi:Tfp pilus assembly protein PilX
MKATMKSMSSHQERGAVSIFLVIFFALLLSIITMSFISIVIRDATQSTNNDLSRSAYDSAQAGVEDAKRAIAAQVNACTSGSAQCGSFTSYLNKTDCSALRDFATNLTPQLQTGTGNEIKVQSGSVANNFNQAETCVNVQMNTPDYVNSEQAYQSDVIPLNATAAFSSVTVSWFTHTDAGIADTAAFTPRTGAVDQLPRQGAWGANSTPAMLRLELISYQGGTITDISLNNDMRTIFLYPTSGGSPNATFPPRDPTHSNPPSAATPTIVAAPCQAGGTYSCSTTVDLGSLGSSAGRTMFLRVTPIYKNSTFRVQLDSGNVNFAGVQPLVDSTGRANDLYRRVQARVRLQNNVLYPEFAIDDQNAFCKNFSVGSDPTDFANNC